MQHLHHFDLRQDPFQNEPDLRFYFDSAYHRDVQLRIERGLRQHKGLSVLTGEGGTGKTLLARQILDALEEEMFDANLMVMLAGAADAESVLSRFARQVGVEAPSSDRSSLLAQIYEQLAIVREDGRHCVLILDDAHILGREAMAEVGGLLNLEYEDRRLLSLLLVGLPMLDVTISHDPSLAQRVDVRANLQPLDLRNAAAYLLHRLNVVGGSPEIFPQDSVASLFKYSRGRPRLLNTLADNSLFEAYLDGSSNVASSHVERSAGDLGIGPDPGSTYQSVPMPRAPATPRDVGAQDPVGLPSLDASDLGDAADLPGAIPVPSAAPVTAASGPVALELLSAIPAGADIDADADDEIDLGSLLADDDVQDLTVVSMGAPSEAPEPRDLDLEIASPGDSLSSQELPAFSAENAPASGQNPEETRIAFLDEQAGPEAEDAIDDLFVELIEE